MENKERERTLKLLIEFKDSFEKILLNDKLDYGIIHKIFLEEFRKTLKEVIKNGRDC